MNKFKFPEPVKVQAEPKDYVGEFFDSSSSVNTEEVKGKDLSPLSIIPNTWLGGGSIARVGDDVQVEMDSEGRFDDYPIYRNLEITALEASTMTAEAKKMLRGIKSLYGGLCTLSAPLVAAVVAQEWENPACEEWVKPFLPEKPKQQEQQEEDPYQFDPLVLEMREGKRTPASLAYLLKDERVDSHLKGIIDAAILESLEKNILLVNSHVLGEEICWAKDGVEIPLDEKGLYKGRVVYRESELRAIHANKPEPSFLTYLHEIKKNFGTDSEYLITLAETEVAA